MKEVKLETAVKEYAPPICIEQTRLHIPMITEKVDPSLYNEDILKFY